MTFRNDIAVLYLAARAALRARTVPDLCRDVCAAAVEGGAAYVSVSIGNGHSARAGADREAPRAERLPLFCDGCACGEMALAAPGDAPWGGGVLPRLADDFCAALSGIERRRRSEEARERLARIAAHDALTGLPNRGAFHDAVRAAAAADARFAVLFVDLDGFKAVNDRLGHRVGDRVLVELAGRLRVALRAGDLVARHAGDEFVALLPGVAEPADAARLCRELVARLSDPLPQDCGGGAITASVGAALSPRDGSDPDALIALADMSMYGAKRAGKNGYRIHDEPQIAAEAAE